MDVGLLGMKKVEEDGGVEGCILVWDCGSKEFIKKTRKNL